MEKGLSKMADTNVVTPNFQKNSTKHLTPTHSAPPIAAKLALPEARKMSAALSVLENTKLLVQSGAIPASIYDIILDSEISDIAGGGYENPPAA